MKGVLMSATRGKGRFPRRWVAASAAGAAALALLVVAALGVTREETKPDTAKVVTSISITGDGIVIQGRVGENPDSIKIIAADRATRAATAKAEEALRRLKELEIGDYDSEGHDIVRFGEDIHIRADKRIRGSVVAIGGSVYVEGQVVGDVVAVGGSVTLESGSSVNGDAVAVGGRMQLHSGCSVRGDAVSVGGKLIEEEGAFVAGDTVSMDFIPMPSFILGGIHSPFAWMGITVHVVWLLVILLLAWASAAIFPDRVGRMVSAAGSSIWLSALVGFAAIVAFPLAILLLVVTLIGIPLAIILPIVFALASIVAYAVGAGLLGYRFGSRLVSKAPQELSLAQAVVLGVLIVGGVRLIGKVLGITSPILWPLAAAVAAAAILAGLFIYLAGLGSLLLTRFGAAPKPATVPATPTAPGPTPGAPPQMGASPTGGGSPAGGGPSLGGPA
jgi:hypothetical protein